MARGGINQALVEQAYQALLARGERPTIDAIRRELGDTGSKTTISRYLNDIKAAQGVRLDDEALLSDNLKAMVGRLARQLHTEAQAIVEASEEQQQTALTSLQQQLAEQQQALASTQETLQQTQDCTNRGASGAPGHPANTQRTVRPAARNRPGTWPMPNSGSPIRTGRLSPWKKSTGMPGRAWNTTARR